MAGAAVTAGAADLSGLLGAGAAGLSAGGAVNGARVGPPPREASPSPDLPPTLRASPSPSSASSIAAALAFANCVGACTLSTASPSPSGEDPFSLGLFFRETVVDV